MKKVISLIIALAVFATMALGSGTDKAKNTKSIVDTTQSNAVADNGSGASEEATTTTTAASQDIPTIEQTVVYDDKGVVITAKEYTRDDFWNSDGIKFLIENNTEQNITVSTKAVIVNGYMIYDLFVASVAAGKKTNETMTLSTSELNAAGISLVGEVEIYFHIYDSDTWDTIVNPDCVTIRTSKYDSMDTEADDSGNVLYDADGIKIVGKYVNEDSFWGKSIVLYIENNTEKNFTVNVDDLSVNGFTIDEFFSSEVYAGKKAIDEITLMSSDLEENDIKEIEEVSLKFKVTDENYDTILKTDEITFATK